MVCDARKNINYKDDPNREKENSTRLRRPSVSGSSCIGMESDFRIILGLENAGWLMLFHREPQADASERRHTTLATSRLRFLFVAARIWSHAGRAGGSYSDHYEEKGVFERLMTRLRRIAPGAQGYAAVMMPALC